MTDDDTFHCTQLEMEQFLEGRVWKEIRSWIEARAAETRRNVTADDLISEDGKSKAMMHLLKAQMLEELLELPELIIGQMQVMASNEAVEADAQSDPKPEEQDDDTRTE